MDGVDRTQSAAEKGNQTLTWFDFSCTPSILRSYIMACGSSFLFFLTYISMLSLSTFAAAIRVGLQHLRRSAILSLNINNSWLLGSICNFSCSGNQNLNLAEQRSGSLINLLTT